jgi:hypothetical protein
MPSVVRTPLRSLSLFAVVLFLSPGVAAAQKQIQQQYSAGDGGGGGGGGGGGLTVAIMGEAGWRWVGLGQDAIPRAPDTFSMAFHGALRMDIGGSSGGLYTYARFDGYPPTGLGTFPWMAQFRMGWFTNVHFFDVGGPRSSSSTSYTGTECYGYTCYDE